MRVRAGGGIGRNGRGTGATFSAGDWFQQPGATQAPLNLAPSTGGGQLYSVAIYAK